MKSLLLDALAGKNPFGPPVWIMRQAGRYLPSYRAIRKKNSFHEMSHTPELAAQVTLLPFAELDLDAAILFSDILVILEALGKSFEIVDGVGPVIAEPVRSEKELDSRNVEETLSYVSQTIKLLKAELKVPLLGFCGAPFTVASYLIEGKPSKNFGVTKSWMFSNPESFHKLLEKITTATISYMKMQKKAGVDAFQIFDTWAKELSPTLFQTFCIPHLKQIIDAAKEISLPTILFARGSAIHLSTLASLNPTALSLDWSVFLPDVRKKLGSKLVLQGNFDPTLLYAPKEIIKKEVVNLLHQMSGDSAYICNLGHGLFPDTPVDGVKAFVDTVKEFQTCQNQKNSILTTLKN